MKKIDLNEDEVVFAPKDGKPGYIVNGKWMPVDQKDYNTPELQKELDRYARLRGQEQLKRDQEKLKSQSTQPPKSQFPDLRGGDNKVDGYGNPKVNTPQPQSLKVEPYNPSSTTPTPSTSTPSTSTPTPSKDEKRYKFSDKRGSYNQTKAEINRKYDALRYGKDGKIKPVDQLGKAKDFGLNANAAVFPNQKIFVNPKTGTPVRKSSTSNPTTAVTGGENPRSGTYADYQKNILNNLGSDYGRLPADTIKPVARRTMKKEAYDMVLDYLVSEGHVDTVEEAHYVMLQMTSEHVQDIVEGKYSSGSVTYVKGTAPVRASYGGKPESFTKETYKKKGKV